MIRRMLRRGPSAANDAGQRHAKRDSGCRIAIVDIDFHHGNGTQEVFYKRSDVFYCSIHADPDVEFPYFSGRADERGVGQGKGCNLNIPLPLDTSAQKNGYGVSERAYLSAVDQAAQAVRDFDADILVVSAGLDTYFRDPVGGFGLEAKSYTRVGRKLAELQLPTLLVQEGGYDLAGLADCIEALLQPFVDRKIAVVEAHSPQRPVLSNCQRRRRQQRREEEGEAGGKKQRLQHHTRRKRGRPAVRVVEFNAPL